MINRMEDAIDAVKRFQYNRQIFQDKPMLNRWKKVNHGKSDIIIMLMQQHLMTHGLKFPVNPKLSAYGTMKEQGVSMFMIYIIW